jgi:signal transduction histidine kinase
MSLPIKTSRRMQLATVAMLVMCLAQMLYWLYDEATFSSRELDRKLVLYEVHLEVAQRMQATGTAADEMLIHFPELQVRDGQLEINQRAVEALRYARRRRLIRYGSEGTFLLLVILGGIATLSYTLRQPAELMRRQSNFIAAVSHEFKSPIASLKLSCETLLMREFDHENQVRLAQRMLESTDRLESMVSNILQAGRMDAGQLELHPIEQSLSDLVAPLAEKIRQRSESADVTFDCDVAQDLTVYCDSMALSMAIDNLFSNAFKSVTIHESGHIGLVARPADGEVLIEVTDDGIGFDPAEARKLFEKFYRPGDELRRQSEGSGLGLYIVETLIQESGGRVQARSAGPGLGATFSIWLPKHSGVRT